MHKLEDKLKFLILEDVEFKINDKIYKKGKIKIFNTKQFFVKFKIDTGDSIKEFELPYPYKTYNTANGLIFDYCLSAFIPPTEESYWRMKSLNSSDSSKIHESYMYIEKTT